jgi:hypothetical protein
MSDSEIALKETKNKVKAFTLNVAGSLAMLYGRVGEASGPKDALAIADGRATIATKLGDDSKLKAFEDAIKALNDWASA